MVLAAAEVWCAVCGEEDLADVVVVGGLLGNVGRRGLCCFSPGFRVCFRVLVVFAEAEGISI